MYSESVLTVSTVIFTSPRAVCNEMVGAEPKSDGSQSRLRLHSVLFVPCSSFTILYNVETIF